MLYERMRKQALFTTCGLLTGTTRYFTPTSLLSYNTEQNLILHIIIIVSQCFSVENPLKYTLIFTRKCTHPMQEYSFLLQINKANAKCMREQSKSYCCCLELLSR